MSKYFEHTMDALRSFVSITPFFESKTYSKDKGSLLAEYDWGHGIAYVKWKFDDGLRRVQFSVDYGIYCEKPYIMQVNTFLAHLNIKRDEVKMVLHPDGRVLSEGMLSYKNAALKSGDFDDLFTASFFYEPFIEEIRKLAVGGFVFTSEIIETKLENRYSFLLDDSDDDDDFDVDDPIVPNTPKPLPNFKPKKRDENDDFLSFLQSLRENKKDEKVEDNQTNKENADLIHLINSSKMVESDSKGDTSNE